MAVIVLLTDFGARDSFVGMMKGAILKIAPDSQIVDLTHEVASFDLRAAAFLLERSIKHFPVETVFITVVDPGVGGERRILAASAGEYFFVGPDNGVLSFALADLSLRCLVSIENPRYYSPQVEDTFHGRDIMAPAAAHITRGVPIRELGPVTDSYRKLEAPSLKKQANAVVGEVVYVDKFGNMITNISRADLPAAADVSELTCTVGDFPAVKFRSCYSEASELSAIISGMGTVEIFLNQGRAADQFGKPVGTVVAVRR